MALRGGWKGGALRVHLRSSVHTFVLQQPRACSQRATAHGEKVILPLPNATTTCTGSAPPVLAPARARLPRRGRGGLFSAAGNPEEKRDKKKTATQMLKKTNPPCPSCVPPFPKLRCRFPVAHPTGLALFGLTDAVAPSAASRAGAPHPTPRQHRDTAPPAAAGPGPDEGGWHPALLHAASGKGPFLRCSEERWARHRHSDAPAASSSSEVQVPPAASPCCRHRTQCQTRRKPSPQAKQRNDKSSAKNPQLAAALACAASPQLRDAASAAMHAPVSGRCDLLPFLSRTTCLGAIRSSHSKIQALSNNYLLNARGNFLLLLCIYLE